MKKPNILFRRNDLNSGEILIYDQIGQDFWFEGVSAKGFIEELDALGPMNKLDVRINSPGGSIDEGIAIYNALNRHKARIVTHVDGIAASIASVIAMAGDEIQIADNALMMIHPASGGCFGCAEDMEKVAEILRKDNQRIAEIYATRTGKAVADWEAAMSEETWYNAKEALAAGLATSITPGKSPENTNAAARFDLSRFHKVPEALKRESDNWKVAAANRKRQLECASQNNFT